MKRKIILNWLPPAIHSFPSPSMSLLKSCLVSHGYDVEIIYWNFLLEPVIKDYWKREREDNEAHLLYFLAPFYNYLAIESQEQSCIDKQINLIASRPEFKDYSTKEIMDHLQGNYILLKNTISNQITSYNLSECLYWGFTQKLFQLFGASIVSEIIKEIDTSLPIIMGGNDTKEEALAMLDNFTCFDYAIWGEGEFPLIDLTDQLLKTDLNLDSISHLLYYRDNEIKTTNAKYQYFDIDSDLIADYSDYFQQSDVNREKIRIPIEGSRGCHWSKCSFCFHNEGVKYRRKSPEKIANEIKRLIKEYGIFQFSFLDNDTIGHKYIHFDILLGKLIEIKKIYPQFNITRAEIITWGLTADTVLKMHKAGFRDVQIGYESLSEQLLLDIKKRNTFASNFLFSKWALHVGIKIRGANLIMNLPEETESVLLTTLKNLEYLRFILSPNHFMHVYTTLWIKRSSKYYEDKTSINPAEGWMIGKDFDYIPSNYISDNNKHTLIFFEKRGFHKLWDDIEEKEYYYFRNPHNYKITNNQNTILYQEFCNKQLIRTYELSKEKEWKILESCNKRIMSCVEIANETNLSIEEVINCIIGLKILKILYFNNDFTEVVSIINTQLVE